MNDKPIPFETVVSRREFLRSALFGGAAIYMASSACTSSLAAATSLSTVTPLLTFKEIPKQFSASHTIAPHYTAKPLLRWGDALDSTSVPFNPETFTASMQARSVGYNCDYTAYLPITRGGVESDHGLLCVNHEYTNRELMFPDVKDDSSVELQRSEIEMQALGCSIVEVKRDASGWHYVPESPYNRRITATTPMQFSGAASGHASMQTNADPAGRHPIGTMANCSGGVTPWGTILTAEENIDYYFDGNVHPDYVDDYKRYTIAKTPRHNWHKIDPRFDVGKEPNEPNRFGWIVEYDPYDPNSVPVKHTALGRFKHECATTVLNHDGHIVVYSGDDEVFEYLYRFVSKQRYRPDDMNHNRTLLHEGTLSVARFSENGVMHWIPLVFGQHGLTQENGFYSQADILIHARRAADQVGATPMDRPEDVDVNPLTGSVFVALTNNKERQHPNVANDRIYNRYGHILELSPPVVEGNVAHSATNMRWDVLLKAGDPHQPAHGAWYPRQPSHHGWLANPDNLTSDARGCLWICTDGQQTSIGQSEGLYATECIGAYRGQPKLFFTSPKGAEITGVSFTPDSRTMFVSVQHPGDNSSYRNPSTRWPDASSDMPPRPSVIAIEHSSRHVIGS